MKNEGLSELGLEEPIGNVEPIMYDYVQAAKALNFSAKFLRVNKEKMGVPFRQFGRLVRFPVRALEQWANSEEGMSR